MNETLDYKRALVLYGLGFPIQIYDAGEEWFDVQDENVFYPGEDLFRVKPGFPYKPVEHADLLAAALYGMPVEFRDRGDLLGVWRLVRREQGVYDYRKALINEADREYKSRMATMRMKEGVEYCALALSAEDEKKIQQSKEFVEWRT